MPAIILRSLNCHNQGKIIIMRLISNIGSERVADVLPTNTPFDLITSSVSLEGAAVMAVAHKIERCQTAFKRHPRSASKRDPLFG